MGIVSFSFYLFILVAIFAYYILPKKCQWWVLLVVSIIFFMFNSRIWTILYLAAGIISTWLVGLHISNFRQQTAIYTEEQINKKCKGWLIAGLVINLGILAALKYTNFVLGNASIIRNWFTSNDVAWRVNWPAALGMSFYTLQIVGYLLDCYWGIAKPQTNLGKMALFTCFFPQMVSGPISRYNQLGEQLYSEHSFKWSNMREGTFRIVVGLFKKIVVAESAGYIARAILDANYVGPIAVFGLIIYVLQIYADFAGCMDIVLGVAKLFDIDMVENFKSPFRSRSIQEFWRNWHITLGSWLKDYVMYPILRTKTWNNMNKKIKNKWGKRAAKLIPTHIAMLILWFFMGLWHGGGWNFILEGIWFWLVIVIGEWCMPVSKKLTSKINTESWFWIGFQRIRTFVIYAIGALMFRCSSVKHFFGTFNRMIAPKNIYYGFRDLFTLGIKCFTSDVQSYLITLLLGFIIFWKITIVEYKKGSMANWLKNKPVMFQALIITFLLFGIYALGTYGVGYNAANFIYGGF